MIFTRLRLTGFKSFVDPTELLIEPGITGVVGPNGCGKSNLLEALRWVMGETSYKSLRGSAMDDVIFSGSSERPPRNTAEVTVTLDNSDRTAPAAFNADDVIEVSRRIERDVGSAYRINGRDARARDVQMLFADAATGAHSIALVRQGQIGEMIAAKPQARRKVLEEAAGIQGLHHRRHEAELRLRAAEQNLGRLDDLIGEIDNQLQALRRQARQAGRYRRLSNAIRKSEALTLHLRWAEARKALEGANTDRDQARTAVQELTEQAAQATITEAAVAEKLAPLREAEAEAAAALQRLKNEDRRLAAEVESAIARREELETRLRQIAEDRERESGIRQDLAAQLETLARETEELEGRRASEAETMEAAKAETARARGDLEDAEETLATALAAIAEGKAAAANAAASLRDAEARVARFEKEAADCETAIEAIRAEDLPDLSAHQKTVEDASALLADVEAKAESTTESLEASRTEEAQVREAHNESIRSLDRLTAEAAALEPLARLGTEDGDKIFSKIAVEPGYEQALTAALGDDLDASTDPGATMHWRALDAFAASDGLPDGAEPLAQFVNGPDALSRRLAFTGLVEEADGDVLQRLLRPGQRLVSRSGTVWRWDGLIVKAGAETAATRRLAARNRLEALNVEIDSAREIEESARSALEDARTAVREAEERDRKTRDAWHAAGKALSTARDTLTGLEQSSRETRERLGALEQRKDRIGTDLSEAMAAREQATKRHASVPDPESLEVQSAPLRSAVAEARAAFAETQAREQSLVRAAEEAADRQERLAGDKARVEARAANADQHIAALEGRYADAEAQKAELDDLPDTIGAQRSELSETITEAEKMRQQAADRLAGSETELNERTRDMRALESSLADAREKLARSEAMSEAADERHILAERAIQDALDCRPEQALAIADLEDGDAIPPLGDVEAELNKLRSDRERLGAVNLRAEDEANEQETRVGELKTERDDLEKAIRRLRQGIGTLNTEARGRLLEAFEEVNQHFGELFQTLFGGGTAELTMTEAEDPLEAGLEVVAKPPGKKPQTLTLLSGGEQALTALALILAVFQTNPSPICVLDEVDAPLDDANVERFCNLILKLTQETQTRFLVITHHPYSMARMDRLFGVTMAERGVSQLVSVDLDTAERFREAG